MVESFDRYVKEDGICVRLFDSAQKATERKREESVIVSPQLGQN
jgi:hypothetical protein